MWRMYPLEVERIYVEKQKQKITTTLLNGRNPCVKNVLDEIQKIIRKTIISLHVFWIKYSEELSAKFK